MTIFNTTQITVCAVSDVLVMNRGNQAKTSRDIGVNRGSLRGWIQSGDDRKLLVQVSTEQNGYQSFKLINHGYGGKL